MIHSRLRLVLSAAHRPDGYGIRTEDVKSPPTRRSNATRPLSAAGPCGVADATPAASQPQPYRAVHHRHGTGRRRPPPAARGVSGGSREPGGSARWPMPVAWRHAVSVQRLQVTLGILVFTDSQKSPLS